jgi:predicted Zn-dependent protease
LFKTFADLALPAWSFAHLLLRERTQSNAPDWEPNPQLVERLQARILDHGIYLHEGETTPTFHPFVGNRKLEFPSENGLHFTHRPHTIPGVLGTRFGFQYHRQTMRRTLLPYIIKALVGALIALALYGALPGGELVVIVGLFVAIRSCYIIAEALRRGPTVRDWDGLHRDYARVYQELTPEERLSEAAALHLSLEASPDELAQEQVRRMVQRLVPPRRKRELAAEFAGLIGIAALIPLDIALYTANFFSFRNPQGLTGAAVLAACVLLYGWPHFGWRDRRLAKQRTLWWVVPFAPALIFLMIGIQVRHPYLNPFHPEQARLAAERVLALGNNVVAGRHADWVLRYARQLDEQGDWTRAAYFYREGLRLDPGDQQALARLAALDRPATGRLLEFPNRPSAASAPFWTPDQNLVRPPLRGIDTQLEELNEFAIVIVAIGKVDRSILDAAGDVLRRELNIPAYLATNAVPVPAHTRVRGLLTGKQWDYIALIRTFQSACEPFPSAPVKYLLITPVDLYGEGMNYAFSTSFEWGAIVSLARLGDPMRNPDELRHRAAKQTLCAILKSFRVPMSPDRDCVTSYSRSLEELDRKGNRPNESTLALFARTVTELNHGWRQHRALTQVEETQ